MGVLNFVLKNSVQSFFQEEVWRWNGWVSGTVGARYSTLFSGESLAHMLPVEMVEFVDVVKGGGLVEAIGSEKGSDFFPIKNIFFLGMGPPQQTQIVGQGDGKVVAIPVAVHRDITRAFGEFSTIFIY